MGGWGGDVVGCSAMVIPFFFLLGVVAIIIIIFLLCTAVILRSLRNMHERTSCVWCGVLCRRVRGEGGVVVAKQVSIATTLLRMSGFGLILRVVEVWVDDDE